ncbi:signal peptide peptidase SppA, 67K type [Aggregatibacter actinomycetemcomitans serotype e str. SC1083]|uniref:Signal peptide peptidase SppA, 67K type n=1 Tax=Aggregatibacter actinomycetemcomitans serotype e str. SC1083 TaxID=907488 RepID=G4A7G5_AGGAC|nr:signal peptide peptidase SppA [Aggregatibacter actinomycetemcomitans]EGY34369.1 signal peptide peptidase SppA, 67K type [Aggregatibacter actinomycetemcomitans serotype e str. SC1083]KYK72573.1 protease [Aggregatibacter actinomycetemcomitans serotype e str. SA3096]KYK78672.1 protease [Aggregatibacter actinomycetemcomitans serotype e str. SC936]KYK96192.1 protease [Aggregatibacter actinomycetemcomitans serotype e str. ANH9776]TYB22195.1 signal peptide peptidase SppA [Aggregatibacter actinomyc
MKVIFSIIKFAWRTLNFIRDLVMNVVFLVFVLLLLTALPFVVGLDKQTVALKGDQGALYLNLDGYLADNRDNQGGVKTLLKELDNQHIPQQYSTFDVVYAIDSAALDDKVRGLVLDLNYFQGGDFPSLEFVGASIENFKKNGKQVIAYSDNYNRAQYFLASYADEVYMNPVGTVSIDGLVQENLYYKDMLDSLEVNPHVFRVGTYKSAVEPFLRNDMSDEAKTNLRRWLDIMWNNYKQRVAENRNVKEAAVAPNAYTYLTELKALQGDMTAYVKQRKLVNGVLDRFNLDKKLTALFGENEDKQPKMVDYDTYLASLPNRMSGDTKNKIAVVNVEGAIIDGETDEENVGGDTIANLLHNAYDNNEVKAVVLRVNSPGGSAFASEIIRQELSHLQQAGKPVVVSMGGMAASGGYWISSTADYIVADKNTITGSIGIFAVLPTFEKTIKKIGVSADGVKTSDLALGSAFSPLSSELNDVLQLEIEHGYDEFLAKVSQGRRLSKAQVDKIAQGQVWLGSEAIEHKLVDELGDLNTALGKAMELVNEKLDESSKIREEDFSVEWLDDDSGSFFKKFMRDFKGDSKAWVTGLVTEAVGLPKEFTQVKKQLGLLNTFNDPKGQYLYCLTCGKVQ